MPELVGHYFSCPDGRKPNTLNTSYDVDETITPFVAVNVTIVDAPDATIVDAAATHAIDTVTTLVHVAPTTIVDIGAATPDPLYCYCKRTEDVDDMVACDNAECKIEWFHFFCVEIKNTPKGKWFCPECRQLPQFSKQKQYKAK